MPTLRNRPRLPAPRLVALLAGLAVATLVAACGSGSSASSSSGTSGSGGGSKLTSADQSGLAKAKAFLAKAEQRPSQITATGKIGKAVPTGKTIDWISCGNTPECTQEGNIVKQAASLLHWKTVILANNGTPQDEKAAFNQVVRTKPAAVLYSAIPASTFASEVPAMKKNGTFISACCITDAVGSTTGIDYAVGIPDQVAPIAGGQAALVAAGSQDTGSVLVVNIPDFQILNISTADFYHSMASYCPSCKVSKLNIALANIGTATSTTVSYLRAHPAIKWVVAETDALTIGLPAALKEAGLSDVKIIGQGATDRKSVV